VKENQNVIMLVQKNMLNEEEFRYFYNLEPIGIGTSIVESLTSYIVRLAKAHNVRVHELIKHIINLLLEPKSKNVYKTNIKNRSFEKYLIGTGGFTIRFIDNLEKLTSRTDLSYLTFTPWSGILTTNNISTYKSWCTKCLSKMKSNGILYCPLLWNLSYVNVCPIHNIRLNKTCPVCGKTQTKLNINIANCKNCNAWLGENSNINNSHSITEFDLWVATAIGELLKVTPTSNCFPTKYFGVKLLSDLELNSTIHFEDVLRLVINNKSERSHIAATIIYNLSSIISQGKYGGKDYLEVLLGIIYVIGSPINILVNYSFFDITLLKITNELKQTKNRTLQVMEMNAKFDDIIHRIPPDASRNEIIKIIGAKDELLVNYIIQLFEEKKV
jgi:hypothetical protein